MGLPLISVRHPTPGLDGSDDGLAFSMDVNVLDGDLLVAAASVALQSFHRSPRRPSVWQMKS
jgi:hypothetical protein